MGQVERPLIAQGGKSLLARIFRAVVALRWPIAIFWVLVTIPAGFYAAKVENDSSLDRIIVPNDPDYLATHAFQEVFGRAEFAVLLLESEDPFDAQVVIKQDAIERGLLAIPKLSINSVLSSYREAFGGFEPTPEGIEKFQKFARGTKLFEKQGLSGEHFAMIGLLLEATDRSERTAIIDGVDRVLEEVGGSSFQAVRRVGQPYVNIYFDEATKRSGPVHFGLFGIFVVVLVSVLYRSIRTLIAFLLTLGVSVAVSVGYIGITGGMFTIVSPMVPMTILITTTATLVYLHSRFAERGIL